MDVRPERRPSAAEALAQFSCIRRSLPVKQRTAQLCRNRDYDWQAYVRNNEHRPVDRQSETPSPIASSVQPVTVHPIVTSEIVNRVLSVKSKMSRLGKRLSHVQVQPVS